MLLGEHGTRAHERRLPSRKDTQVRRAQRDFRLAEADVAAQKAVHHFLGTHIGEDLLGGDRLIGRIFIGKRRAEFVHLLEIIGEDVPLSLLPLGIERFEVEGELFQRRAHARFDALELAAADLGERGRVAAHVFGQDVHLLDGHVQNVAVFIGKRDVFLGSVRRFDALDPRDPPHAIRLMYGVVADLGCKKEIAALLFDAAGGRTLGEEIAGADDGELALVQHKSLRQRLLAHGKPREIGQPRGKLCGREILLGERLSEFCRAFGRAAVHDHAVARPLPRFQIDDEVRHGTLIAPRRRRCKIKNFQRIKKTDAACKRLDRERTEVGEPLHTGGGNVLIA